MRILLTDAGKRFNRDWIFRQLNYEFHSGHSYAIIGPNGSGKSTLLQVLAGSMMLNKGTCFFTDDETKLDEEDVYKRVSICAPYLEVVEEMSVTEFLSFHSRFKPFIRNISINDIISRVGLADAADKQIRYYSSGMKQRVKLAQSVFSDVPCVLLDEPCTNLDDAGVKLYHDLIKEYCSDRLLVVSSNDPVEYQYCEERLNIMDHKK